MRLGKTEGRVSDSVRHISGGTLVADPSYAPYAVGKTGAPPQKRRRVAMSYDSRHQAAGTFMTADGGASADRTDRLENHVDQVGQAAGNSSNLRHSGHVDEERDERDSPRGEAREEAANGDAYDCVSNCMSSAGTAPDESQLLMMRQRTLTTTARRRSALYSSSPPATPSCSRAALADSEDFEDFDGEAGGEVFSHSRGRSGERPWSNAPETRGDSSVQGEWADQSAVDSSTLRGRPNTAGVLGEPLGEAVRTEAGRTEAEPFPSRPHTVSGGSDDRSRGGVLERSCTRAAVKRGLARSASSCAHHSFRQGRKKAHSAAPSQNAHSSMQGELLEILRATPQQEGQLARQVT